MAVWGAVRSSTVTVKAAWAVLLEPSVAVQFTVVVPSGNVLPDEGATGVGLTGRLDAPLDSAWHVASVDAGPGYAAAVAATGQGWRVIFADVDRAAISAR